MLCLTLSQTVIDSLWEYNCHNCLRQKLLFQDPVDWIGGPGDWIGQKLQNLQRHDIQSTVLVFQATGSSSDSRPPNPVDWILFQATGFAQIPYIYKTILQPT
jgi:hypothetical protein